MARASMRTKRCRRCRRKRALSQFSPSRRSKDDPGGFYAWCRRCASGYQRDMYRTLEGQLAHRVRAAKTRSKRFGIPFDLDLSHLCLLWDAQKGRCALSGLPFALDDGAKGKQAFRPSLDRIKPEMGYTRDNVRLVATIVNFGINKWGYDAFLQVCRAVARKKRTRI